MLLELISRVASSYQCRVEGQYFSRFRAGAKNLAEMKEALPVVHNLIENGQYDQAVYKLVELKEKLNGTFSNGI